MDLFHIATGIISKILGIKGNLLNIKFRVENQNLEALVPDDEQWGAIKDVLLNREYEYLEEFSLKNFEGSVVYDLGAHVGLYTLLASCFANKVISVEAHPINYKILEINLIKNKINNVIALNRAVVGEYPPNGLVKIIDGEHSGGNRISKDVGSNGYSVEAITIGDLISEYGEPDLLKIDVEGAEFEILQKTPNDVLKSIPYIVGEVHLEFGDISYIIKRLKDLRFKVRVFNPPLASKHIKYDLELKGLNKLKATRILAYSFAKILRVKDKTLMIMFAWR